MATATETTPTPPAWTRRQRIVFGTVIAIGLAMIVYGLGSAVTGDKATTISDPAIERLIPKPGDSLQVNQDTVGIDLVTGYEGELTIDGTLLPTFDLNQANVATPFDKQLAAQYDEGQGTVLFTPREGAAIEAFSPGRHTIKATYWKRTEGRGAARTFTWSFEVKT